MGAWFGDLFSGRQFMFYIRANICCGFVGIFRGTAIAASHKQEGGNNDAIKRR